MRAGLIGSMALAGWLAGAGLAGAADPRELVAMPPEVRDSLLMNMQDHLVTLDTIVAHVASERFTEAARLADERLRFTTTSPAGEAAILSWFPAPMQGAREALRAAAQRFSFAAQQADRKRDYASLRELNWALGDITAACTGCHGHYRVR